MIQDIEFQKKTISFKTVEERLTDPILDTKTWQMKIKTDWFGVWSILNFNERIKSH
jgi:hypothetical protein